MEIRYLPDPEQMDRLNTDDIARKFRIDGLFTLGMIQLVYIQTDRMIVGSAVPGESPLTLQAGSQLAADYFAQRREIGVFNIGGSGCVHVDDMEYSLSKYDMVYIGRGARHIEFISSESANPARLYLVSTPAHTAYPTTAIQMKDARTQSLGNSVTASKRTLYQYVHEEGAQSCQLVMGCTRLDDHSVWNTMPTHTHARRAEVYLYFDLDPDAVVFHLMGEPGQTRHIVVRDVQAVISPGWSIHAGAGTTNYSFVWAMAGENQRFDDMDLVQVSELA